MPAQCSATVNGPSSTIANETPVTSGLVEAPAGDRHHPRVADVQRARVAVGDVVPN